LINDILDLAKVDSGKMTFEQIPFKLTASLASTLHLFETKIQEKNLKLVKDFDKRIPRVLMGDPVRLHQIIINLVSNAVKFTTKGKITVSTRLLVQDEEKVVIEFGVTDTGIGIKGEKLESIFDDFQQATSGTSRLYGGTGLGLAIVKNLVEQQGGTINVASRVKKGSAFSFILSFKKTNEKAEMEIAHEIVVDPDFHNARVLVVEDIALNQLLMKTLLEDFGFDMDIASNGQIALDMMSQNHYDIILMDLQMPIMNGFETTDYIRNTLKSDVPVIALTADVTTVDVEKCRAVGMNDYISKPIDDKILYSKIIKFLSHAGYAKNVDAKPAEDLQTQDLKCVNFDYLKRITKSETRMVQMIGLYLEEIPKLIAGMKKAISAKDWESLKLSTHSLIPTFATMGINPEFEDMAKAIQALAGNLIKEKAGDAVSDETMGMLTTLYLKIETICEQAAEELKKELLVLSETAEAEEEIADLSVSVPQVLA
ncbi:MAG TPA: ATP-binding protein, partial [Adhaeribacter sp.]|nr:ATP-binding protein [Adhaeribacter sp.]